MNLLIQLSRASLASIAADADTVYVSTDPSVDADDGLHAKRGPTVYALLSEETVKEIPTYDATVWAVTPSSLIYAAKGALYRVARHGSKPSRVAPASPRTQYLATVGERVAWVEPEPAKYSIQILDTSNKARSLYRGVGKVHGIAMGQEQVAFFESRGECTPAHADRCTWRIGSVAESGGEPKFTAERREPIPPQLVGSDEAYFYRIGDKEVRRISFDLSKEEIIAQNVDCSLMAVAARIYCANEHGIFEIAKQPGANPTRVATPEETVTDVAASTTRLAWVGDFAADKLTVDMLPIVASGTGAH